MDGAACGKPHGRPAASALTIDMPAMSGMVLRRGPPDVGDDGRRATMTELGQILTGALVGYLIVTVCESYFHRAVGHATPRLRRLCVRAPLLGSFILRAWYAHHVVHHLRTFRRDHVTQFAAPGEEARLRSGLLAQGRGHIVEQAYGVRVGGPGEFLRYVAPTLPVFLAVCWLGGGWFTAGATLPLLVMPLVSELVHPYAHMAHERATREAPPLLRPLLATRYFQFVVRHHWLHHRYLDCNFNLLPGGDFLLGVHRKPSPRDLAEMVAVGLSVAGCRPGAEDPGGTPGAGCRP